MTSSSVNLVRIPKPGPGQVPLSKAQQEFNRLTRKIEELEKNLTDFQSAATTLQQRIRTEYVPLLTQYNKHRADLVRVFDRAHGRMEATKSEKKKLADLILTLAYDLISQHGMDELKPIFDKYDAKGFDASDEEADAGISEVMKDMVSSMYGITFDENADVSTQEKFMAYLNEQMQARNQTKQQARQAKPKSAKQQEREAKKQLEERNVTKAVRTLYTDLVKAFHPDREPDETEKVRKTEIMQRVTEAYEKGDLLTLLRLQLEFNRIDRQHLETLADDQLRYYNKILKQQADELGDELFSLQRQLSTMLNKPISLISSASSLEFGLNNDIRALKRSSKALRQEVKDLSNPITLKVWLKAYTVQKADDSDGFAVYFG